MFIDELVLTVVSGAGGDGCSAFRREKYVPLGGPAGGDGGRGGDIILVADPQLTTFGDMPSDRVVRASPGGPGKGNNRHGSDGQDRIIGVPPGTRVLDAASNAVLVELVQPGARFVLAPGGKGGYGNSRFATSTDQAPTRTTSGGLSITRRVRLELRLLADVGLVGLPNAGKSTLLSRLSRASPRIAAYPFTTLAPHLGLVERPGFRRFVLADLPGLVEGAHEGRGLGDRFLRHAERTRVLVHCVDLFPLEGKPATAYRVVRRELDAYGGDLSKRPELILGTKADLAPPAAVEKAAAALGVALRRPVIVASAATGLGLDRLLAAIGAILDAPRVAVPARSTRAPRKASAKAKPVTRTSVKARTPAKAPAKARTPAKAPAKARTPAKPKGRPGPRPTVTKATGARSRPRRGR